MLIGDPLSGGAVLALPMRSSKSGEPIPQSEGLRRPEGSGMLISDPLW